MKRLLIATLLLSLSLIFAPSAHAVACGINIDPANPAGYPSPSALPAGSWVRLEYKDCTTDEPAAASTKIYGDVLKKYKSAGIKTLVILDYLTYPDAAAKKEKFADRAEYINQQIGGQVDAYEIWNEPDIAQGGGMSPQEFAEILDAVVPKLSGKKVVLGGLASGHAGYLNQTLSAVSNETLVGISAIGVHPYAKSVDGFPGPMTGDMAFLMSQYKAVSKGKPLWITEIGINTTIDAQITGYLDRVFAAGLGDPTFWFAWSDGMVDNFGIVDAGQNPKANFANYYTACGATAPTGKQPTLPAITPPGGQGCGGSSAGIPGNNDYKIVGDLDQNLFHLAPIAGLYPEPGRRNYAQIRNDLVEQGYQAYCAIPEQGITGSVGPQDLVKYFVAQGGSKELELSPILTLDYSLASTPLFRDSERKFHIKSDLEEYWSYQESASNTYSQAELSSAPIESLLTKSQRCGEGIKNILALDEMCSKLRDPNSCALYTFPIAQTSHTIRSLLTEYRSVGGNRDNSATICKELEKSSETKKQQLFADFQQVPLTTERGFRLAFLVLSLKEIKKDPNRLFSFFAHNTNPRDEVLVVAFKIPDVITNKPTANTITGSNSKAYPFFSDGAMLARDSLLTTDQQQKAGEREIELKTNLSENVAKVSAQNPDNAIYCLDGEPPFGTGSIACKDQLVKALTDIINAQELIDSDQLKCVGEDEIDDSYSIDEPAAIGGQAPAAVFSDELGARIISQLFLSLGGTSPDKAVQTFLSTFTINEKTVENGLTGNTSLKSYLVYPVGYELAEVENVLANSFLTKVQIAELESDKNNNERFELFGGTTKLTDNTAGFSIFYPPGCNPVSDNSGCYRDINAVIEMGILKPIQFLGARLGYYLRAVQRTLAKEASSVQTYLAACKTTEEFLLDRCASIQQKEPQQSLTYCSMKELAITNASTEKFKICKATWVWDSCELIDKGNAAYFLDSSSKHTLEYSLRILDGATLITTGSVVTMNPGQGYNKNGSIPRCSGHGHSMGAGPGEIWYLPANTPADKVELEETWNTLGSKLMLNSQDIDWINYVVKLQVKAGYYYIPNWDFGCLSKKNIWIDKTGKQATERLKLGSSIIPVGVTASGRSSYCTKISLNSNMPGGPDGAEHEYVNESFGCPVAGDGYDIMLNTSCGGLNGSDDLRLWSDFFKENANPPGLAQYEKIFGIKFTLPNENTSCGELFPNTIREVNCNETSNSDVGSIANFGKDIDFEIEYWNGSTVRFRPPSEEIWSSINKAASRHGCDPLLVLAVAHSESSEFRNDTVSSAGGKGVWQFPPGPWGTWWTPYNSGAPSCANHEPTYFTAEYKQNLTTLDKNLDFSTPTNIPAAADAACRLILWTGMQKYPENENEFAEVFAIRGENSYGQIWNPGQTHQAKYAWKLWRRLRAEMEKSAVAQPASYPPSDWESCRTQQGY
ncbi:MAG: glycosyl hydrolase [bacterium]|nr:glycosyl hydrolase [bacterium]